MKLQLVRPEEDYDYNIVVAQESSVSGAAAAVIASTVEDYSSRPSCVPVGGLAREAFNASAKKLAKKLAALRAQ